MSYLYFYVLRSVKGGGGIQCDNMHISTTLQPRRKNKSLMPYIHIQTHIYKKVCNIHPLTTETRLYTPPPNISFLACLIPVLDQIAPSLLLLVTLRNAAPGHRERRQLTYGANFSSVGKLHLAGQMRGPRCSGMEDQETGRLN